MRSGSNPAPGHLSLDVATAWVDAAILPLGGEDAPISEAWTRVLAADIRAAGPIPPADRAALDGFAVRADECLGASAYNPLELPLIGVAAGDDLPVGTDAVVPLDNTEPDGRGRIIVVEPIAPGEHVERQGAVATRGTVLAPSGTRLAAHHIGMLAEAGLARVFVIRQPRVQICRVKPTQSETGEESNSSMIRAVTERDGGTLDGFVISERGQAAIRDVLVETTADIILVIGGTGLGVDDHAAGALADAGELAIYGMALRPGETTGLGRCRNGVPVVLLPGAPAACLWSYELIAGRAIRRLGGHNPELPYCSREKTAARKMVSSIGTTEICPVRLGAGDTIEPLPSFAETGLMAAVAADGFVIVPESSEGYPQGARVTVYLYEGS